MLDGRYRLDTPIAAGGMGEVWRGTDLALSRAVAIKLLHPEHASQPDGLARFRAEAQHAGSLSHPNIAQIYDYCEPAPPDPAYLVLELVDGPSLARHLDGGPLSPARTLDVIEQAASGLAAAHRAGLLHRDIKPGNLLLSHDGLIKITDFGIARAAGSLVHTRTGALTGTPAYLAPERFAGAPATPASDLYALGVLAHQCLTGQLPFAGDPLVVALAHVERDMPPLPDSVPAELAALVADLTRKDPRARPASAVAVLARAGLIRAAVFGSAANSAFGGTASAGTSFAGTSAAAGTESGHTAAMDSPAGYSPAGYSPAGYSPAGYSPSGVQPSRAERRRAQRRRARRRRGHRRLGCPRMGRPRLGRRCLGRRPGCRRGESREHCQPHRDPRRRNQSHGNRPRRNQSHRNPRRRNQPPGNRPARNQCHRNQLHRNQSRWSQPHRH